MTEITQHLTDKLVQGKICLNSTESKKLSLLQFVGWSVNSKPQSSPSMPLLGDHPPGVCRITSPWVDLVVERKPVPLVRGIFRYNERQLLADQALLAGAHNVPPGVAMPFSYEEFSHYADFEYVPSEITHQPVKKRNMSYIPPRLTPYITGKEFRQYVGLEHLPVETDYYYPAEKPIEERVPPDLLWLFQRASHDPRYYLSGLALGSMGLAMEADSKNYTQIVTSLIDRCFESDGEDIHYDSILDLDDPALLEQYKLVTPLISMPE